MPKLKQTRVSQDRGLIKWGKADSRVHRFYFRISNVQQTTVTTVVTIFFFSCVIYVCVKKKKFYRKKGTLRNLNDKSFVLLLKSRVTVVHCVFYLFFSFYLSNFRITFFKSIRLILFELLRNTSFELFIILIAISWFKDKIFFFFFSMFQLLKNFNESTKIFFY